MGKVKIAVNDSGSGTVTIEAPPTNSSRTLELPDSDGKVLALSSLGSTGQILVSTGSSSMPALQNAGFAKEDLSNVGTLTSNVINQLRGPQGIQGPSGSNGSNGAQGPQGPTGPTGSAGGSYSSLNCNGLIINGYKMYVSNSYGPCCCSCGGCG